MREMPILFSAPMVRALLDGSKTQTRRAMKPQPTHFNPAGVPRRVIPTGGPSDVIRCPYGQPGDRLWVREAFDFLPSGGPDQPQACEIVYWATGSTEPRSAPNDYNPMIYGHQKVRPSIHMPRWASRITLEVTGVRVETLQDISEADAVAEGCKPIRPELVQDGLIVRPGRSAVEEFRLVWEQIHGGGSWEKNPFVWVVTFRRIDHA